MNWSGIRDSNLIGILRALKVRDWGAGATLNRHDKALARLKPVAVIALEDADHPLRMLDLSVLPAWIDYNGHMTEFRYSEVFSDTCDRLLLMIGQDPDYVASGCSYYTAEAHISFVDEVKRDERIYTTTQLLFGDAKRLHVFHRLHAAADDRILATAEHMYLHVDRRTGKVAPASAAIIERVSALAAAQAKIPRPDAAGRHVGQR